MNLSIIQVRGNKRNTVFECNCLVAESKFSIETEPASGSVITDLEGSVNGTSITCNIFSAEKWPIVWHLQNVQGNPDIQPLSDSANMFVVHNDSDLHSGSHSFKLTILNSTSTLDGVVVFCGTAERPRLANFTIRIIRKYKA